MPEEKERPRPHGDPLEPVIERNPDENRGQSQSDAPPDEIPRRSGLGESDVREISDRARGRGSSANGIPEFDEDAKNEELRMKN